MSFSNGKATHQRQTSASPAAQFIDVEGIPARLAHLATVFVDHEAMGQDGFVRGHASDTQCGNNESWNQPRCWSDPSRYKSRKPMPRARMTAFQTSRIHPHVKDVIGLLRVDTSRSAGASGSFDASQPVNNSWLSRRSKRRNPFAKDSRNRSHRSTGHQDRAVGIAEGGNGQAPCTPP